MTSQLTLSNVAVGFAVFGGTLVLNLFLVGVILLKLPPTYFSDDYAHERSLARKVTLNLVGLALVVAGMIMSLPGVPGQGLLTIVIGIVLMDVPGKRPLARAVLSRNGILDRINRFRERFGMAPFILGHS